MHLLQFLLQKNFFQYSCFHKSWCYFQVPKLNNRIQVDEVLQVNFYARKVYVAGKGTRSLTPIETKLLYILMRHAGKIVTNEFLINRLWQDDSYGDQLHVFVYRIRQKIEPDPKNPVYIQTKRGVGYRFTQTRY